MPTILITSMGGSGSLNLVDTLRMHDKAGEFTVVGTHCDPYELSKSDLEHLYVVPKAADEEAFWQAHLEIFERHKVDLLIANSDKEVTVFSAKRAEIPCAHLLPSGPQAKAVQDKWHFHQLLAKHGCATVPNVPVPSRDGVGEAIRALPPAEKFWIRLRDGAGSQGATWLYNEEQAKKWMDLWCELRGYSYTDFVVAPFLSGIDYCVSVLYQDGEMAVAKVYQRLRYYAEDVSLSMMGSTPKASITVADRAPIEATMKAVEAVCAEFGEKPHGLYQADLKCDAAGTPYVTEINIGRFPMTSPQFDRVGEYCQFMLYCQMALHPEQTLPRGVFDLDPGKIFLRGVDLPLTIVDEKDVAAIEAKAVLGR